jgi:hypothetical protein
MRVIDAVIALFPMVGAICGISTIGFVYYLTSVSGHLPEGVSTPPISFLGLKSPEHEAYQIGFAVTGGFLICCVFWWSRLMYPALRKECPDAAFYALCGGYAAGFGVIGQGLITLQEDLLEVLDAQGTRLALLRVGTFTSH